jgi:hypothetical protein
MGAVAYVVVRAVFLCVLGASSVWITGALSVTPMFLLAFRLAPRLADALAARVLPKWRAEVARQYGLDERALAETTQFL